MTPTEIDVFLAVQGIEKRDLAKALKLSPQEVGMILSGTRRTARIREKIAKHFHKTVDEFFGADFDAVVSARKGNGQPQSRTEVPHQ